MPVDLKKLPAVHIVSDPSGSVVDLPISSFAQEIPNNAVDDMQSIQSEVANCSRKETNFGNKKVMFSTASKFL